MNLLLFPTPLGASEAFVFPNSRLTILENFAKGRKPEIMKADSYGEIFLWNREVDRLIRVLQRMESAGILSKRERKDYEVRLEEARAGLNAHFAEGMAKRERADQGRLRQQRTAWEKQNTNATNS